MKKNIMIAIGIALLVSSCSVIPGLNQPVEITDATGHTAILDGVPDRIAIAGKATIMVQDAIYLFEDSVEKVIALENRNQSAFSFLPVIDPNLDDKDIFEKNVGPEQIAAVQPDLILLKSFMAESLGEPLEQLSLPVVYLDLETPEAFYQDISTLGQVFGKPDRANEIINYYLERVSLVESLVSDVETIPSVLVLQHSDQGGEVAFKVPPISWLQTSLVEMAGGAPVWKGMEAGGGWTVVNLEQIAAWNADQIFLIDYAGNAGVVKDELMNNQIWNGFTAVQNDQLYAFAFDFYSWDQPDTRWILGLEWLATKIHPDSTSDIDILEEVNTFYSVLYGMDQDTIDSEVLPRLTGDLP